MNNFLLYNLKLQKNYNKNLLDITFFMMGNLFLFKFKKLNYTQLLCVLLVYLVFKIQCLETYIIFIIINNINIIYLY